MGGHGDPAYAEGGLLLDLTLLTAFYRLYPVSFGGVLPLAHAYEPRDPQFHLQNGSSDEGFEIETRTPAGSLLQGGDDEVREYDYG